MQWDEFISRFDMSVFSNLMKELNDESDQRFEDHVKRRKREGYVHELYDFDSYVFKLYDTVVSNGRRLIRYVKKNRSRDNFEEVLLGYFQPFQKGWVFVFMDSSHLWKNIRERATFVMPDWDARVIGSSMIFCNFSQLESDTRYHFLNGEIVDEDRFVFKTGCVRINDVYIGSAKTERFFLILDHAYSSSDFFSNYYVNCSAYFENLKDLTNEDILVIFGHDDLSNRDMMMQRHGDKIIKKLLKL